MGLLKDSNNHFLPKEQGSFSKTKISRAISNTIPNIRFFHFLSRYLCSFTLESPLPSRNHFHPRKKGQRTHEKPYLSCIKPAKVLFFFFLRLPPATACDPADGVLAGKGNNERRRFGGKGRALSGCLQPNPNSSYETPRNRQGKENSIMQGNPTNPYPVVLLLFGRRRPLLVDKRGGEEDGCR